MLRKTLYGVIGGLMVLTGASAALAQNYAPENMQRFPRGFRREGPPAGAPMPMIRPDTSGPGMGRPGFGDRPGSGGGPEFGGRPGFGGPAPGRRGLGGPGLAGPDPGWNGRGGLPDDDGLLPPRAIIGSLSRRGYGDVQIKRVRGDSYIAEANGPDGNRVLVVIDGHTMEITGLRQLGWNQPSRQWDNDGWSPPRPWSGPRW